MMRVHITIYYRSRKFILEEMQFWDNQNDFPPDTFHGDV